VSPDLELALRLAGAADEISLPRFRTGIAFETKRDKLVAEGAVDGAIDALGVDEWDLAAGQVIVEETGGVLRLRRRVADRQPRGDQLERLLHDELLGAVA
jgi:fructose-1,6-bisphosphatase/inositol monophosphatase family enzyme